MQTKITLILSLLIFFNVSLIAQNLSTENDITGKWLIKKPEKNLDRTLNITRIADTVTIKETFTSQKKVYSNDLILFTDNRGEKNLWNTPGSDSPSEVISNTFWKNGKLIRQSAYTVVTNAGTTLETMDCRVTDEYRLSLDGKVLIVDTISQIRIKSDPKSAGRTTFDPPMLRRVKRTFLRQI